MWCCAGRSLVVLLGACAADPDAHFEIARPAGQEVTAQLCDPSLVDCKNGALFAGDETGETVKTLDVFVVDDTAELVLIFNQNATERFCTRIAVTFGAPIAASITLAGDRDTPPELDCGACRLEPCTP